MAKTKYPLNLIHDIFGKKWFEKLAPEYPAYVEYMLHRSDIPAECREYIYIKYKLYNGPKKLSKYLEANNIDPKEFGSTVYRGLNLLRTQRNIFVLTHGMEVILDNVETNFRFDFENGLHNPLIREVLALDKEIIYTLEKAGINSIFDITEFLRRSNIRAVKGISYKYAYEIYVKLLYLNIPEDVRKMIIQYKNDMIK